MRHTSPVALFVVLGVLAAATAATAAEVTLNQVTIPERRTVEVPMQPTTQAPQAEMTAEMSFREGQATIEIRYSDMKPAVLFGGDITSYVLWAVARDGTFENLGELKVRDPDDKLTFTTGLKAFSLLVTAETYPRVSSPSSLVMFTSGVPKQEKKYPAEAFVFSGLGPAPAVGNRSLAGLAWDRNANLDVLQAERVVEKAGAAGAGEKTPDLWREMQTTLAQSRALATKSHQRTATDYAGRAVNLASESLQTIRRQIEAAKLEAQIAKRKAEMAALEERAASAEKQATAAAQQAQEAQQQALEAQQQAEADRQQAMTAQQELAQANQQKADAAAAVAAAQAELAQLATEKDQLRQSVAEESAKAERLKQEKEELSSRLQGALSQVAETKSTARGLIVNLPDILFDTSQATLKPGAREVIAKLSGILLMMPQLNLRIEGHTDSTGSREFNQSLSEKRALSVQDFLVSQGIDSTRMTAVGYGWDRPVADNSTAEGRSKNRRVEIVIGEGTIQEAPASAAPAPR